MPAMCALDGPKCCRSGASFYVAALTDVAHSAGDVNGGADCPAPGEVQGSGDAAAPNFRRRSGRAAAELAAQSW